MALKENQKRSIIKAVSYRFLGSMVTALIALILTGRLGLSATIGLLDIVMKIGTYYLHERVWERINYGRVKVGDYEI